MNKKRYALFTSTVVAVGLLSGCQSLTGYQQIEKAESPDMLIGKVYPVAGEVNIVCAGTYHCEITQVDQTLLIAPNSHKPVNPSMVTKLNQEKLNQEKSATQQPTSQMPMTPLLNQKSVKIVPLSASSMKGLTNYYARVKPAKREVHISFYPENNLDYVERFAMIHDFMQPGTYQLRAYRKKSPQEAGSLLDSASPEPLCVDLMQGSKVVRRFCKQLDAKRQGEFVESKIAIKAANK
ncbi:hypothetical protein [Psychrobacter sp. 16-MNA-CIBAN-0192]|uniref:hypothetical protein n=1 Tax=Psychrobacter sp. 16-MNA-CIBAN-0192 TaxID=3140448 RepID=UPI00332AF69A